MRYARVSSLRSSWSYFSAALIAVAGATGCSQDQDSPETQIRAWIASGVEAAEARERRDLVAMISPAYADARGNGRDDIENMLRAYFLRAKTVALMTSVDEMRIVDRDFAEIALTVGMAGRTDTVLGFSADAYHFELELARDGADWQLISARWAEVGREPR